MGVRGCWEALRRGCERETPRRHERRAGVFRRGLYSQRAWSMLSSAFRAASTAAWTASRTCAATVTTTRSGAVTMSRGDGRGAARNAPGRRPGARRALLCRRWDPPA